MNVVMILRNSWYDMERFRDQIHTVVAILSMDDWYETNVLIQLGRGTVIALDLGVAALALVVLIGVTIIAATKTEEVATPALILRLAKQLEVETAPYLLYFWSSLNTLRLCCTCSRP